MALVHHMLLTRPGITELLAAVQTQASDLNSLGNIRKQAFQVDQTVNIQEGKAVLDSHVVDAFLEAIMLLVAKQTASQTFQGRLLLRLDLNF